MTCDRCFKPIDVGAHGEGVCPYERRSHVTAVHGDDIPGGLWVENGFPHPIKVYSHSEHRAKLAANGYEHRVKNAGPDDKHVMRWDTVDLEGAAALVTRGVQARAAKNAERWPDATIPITITDGGVVRQKDLA